MEFRHLKFLMGRGVSGSRRTQGLRARITQGTQGVTGQDHTRDTGGYGPGSHKGLCTVAGGLQYC